MPAVSAPSTSDRGWEPVHAQTRVHGHHACTCGECTLRHACTCGEYALTRVHRHTRVVSVGFRQQDVHAELFGTQEASAPATEAALSALRSGGPGGSLAARWEQVLGAGAPLQASVREGRPCPLWQACSRENVPELPDSRFLGSHVLKLHCWVVMGPEPASHTQTEWTPPAGPHRVPAPCPWGSLRRRRPVGRGEQLL